jgi:hypothetical protein
MLVNYLTGDPEFYGSIPAVVGNSRKLRNKVFIFTFFYID